MATTRGDYRRQRVPVRRLQPRPPSNTSALRGVRPSVIHAHDWQAGLVPAYQKMLFSPDPVVGGVPVVFTIHNLAFQGVFPADTLSQIALPPDVLHVEAMEFYGRISYLKAGINFSERITTVSPTYAREILTPEMGFGFEGDPARAAPMIWSASSTASTPTAGIRRPTCSCRPTRAADLVREARGKAPAPADQQPGRWRRGAAAAADRPRLAADRPERVRPDRRRDR